MSRIIIVKLNQFALIVILLHRGCGHYHYRIDHCKKEHWSPVLTPVKLINFSAYLVNHFVACMKLMILGSENLSTMSVTVHTMVEGVSPIVST